MPVVDLGVSVLVLTHRNDNAPLETPYARWLTTNLHSPPNYHTATPHHLTAYYYCAYHHYTYHHYTHPHYTHPHYAHHHYTHHHYAYHHYTYYYSQLQLLLHLFLGDVH